MARALYDTAHDVSTPAAGHYKDLEGRVKELAGLVNEHAQDLDVLDANLGGTLTADAPGRAKIAAGFFNAATVDSAFAVGTIGQELLEAELDETVVDNVPSMTAGGVAANLAKHSLRFEFQHVNHATETLVFKTTRKVRIVGLEVFKAGADAGGKVQLTDAADAAITEQVVADTDKAKTSAAQFDPAKWEIPAGGTFKAIFTRGAGASDSRILITVLPIA